MTSILNAMLRAVRALFAIAASATFSRTLRSQPPQYYADPDQPLRFLS